MTTEMDLTDFRRDLTTVIDQLADTGPVRLIRYGLTVAEIHAADPASRTTRTRQLADTFTRLTHMDVLDNLVEAGMSVEEMTELLRRTDDLIDQGATIHTQYAHLYPAPQDKPTVDDVLAAWYFGDDLPEADARAWFRACTTMQISAKQRGLTGDATKLPYPNAYDESEPSFVESLTASGHTPISSVPFAEQAMDQGVGLNQILDLLGADSTPADVLASPNYEAYGFENIVAAGLPVAEASAVVRQRRMSHADHNFVGAGIRTAADLEALASAGVDSELALRAHRDGLTVEEWRTLVPKVQQHRYKKSGLLHFRLLVQAADEGISLVRWDNHSLETEETKRQNSFNSTDRMREDRMRLYPWVEVYPDRILDLAREGISPTYLLAFAKLMKRYYAGDGLGEDFAGVAIEAKRRGLTADMANAMSRSDGKRPHPTARQLLTALDSGLDTAAQAHYLADRYQDMDQWMVELITRMEQQIMVDTWMTTVANTDIWQAVGDAARLLQEHTKTYLRGEVYLKDTLARLVAGESMDAWQVTTLLHVAHAVAHGYYGVASRKWLAQHEEHRDSIDPLWSSFASAIKEGSATSD